MSTSARRATVDDLHRVEGKAELIGGKIVRFPPHGGKSGLVIGSIFYELSRFADASQGEAFMSTLAYTIPELPSGRESLSPDVSYYDGVFPEDPMDFIHGPPKFAAEVRSKVEYSPSEEAERSAKRSDYFQAGTLVVWDVDPVAETVACYRNAADPPVVWKRGDTADAEPAVPGWAMPVNDIFG
jgi:Uma2 family endonuclease